MKARSTMSKLMMIAVVAVMAMTLVPAASAGPGKITSEQAQRNRQVLEMKAQVNSLLQQIGQERTEGLLPSNQGATKQQILNNKIQSQVAQLKALGVTQLTPSEVQAIQARAQAAPNASTKSTAVAPYVTTPPSTSSVEWYSAYYTWTMSNGKQYDVQELYAHGLNGNSNLATGADNAVLYNGANWAVDSVKTMASMYVQKAVGLIPYIQWTPYELLFTNGPGVVNNSELITYRSLETVCFAYVKNHGASDTWQSLSFVSNYVNIASTQVLAGYDNGTPYTRSHDSTDSVYADHYANANSEVQAFIDPSYSQRRDWVSSYRFYNPDRTRSIRANVYNPELPGLVH